jgi:OOP family OmpA-OmpF porin
MKKNNPAGAMVDTKGRSIDKNNNNVPDETEAFILKNYSTTNNSAFNKQRIDYKFN